MKKLKVFLGLIILSIILSSLNANSAIVLNKADELINAYNNNNLVRLHVVANSNSPKDQYLKRKVRDEVVSYMAHYPDKNVLLSEPERIEEHIAGFLKKEGVDYPVEVSFGNYYFPKRTYDDLTLPAGEYRALKIILGKGQGANWWCVLLPPLCIEKNPSEKQKVEFRFKLADILGYKSKIAFSYKLFPVFQEEREKNSLNHLAFELNQEVSQDAEKGMVYRENYK